MASQSTCLVVSQPMYFPWAGMLEQIKHCQIFVYYDDVQFARGFFNRVQIKTRDGVRWLTVPLLGQRRGQLINEVRLDEGSGWRRSHYDLLKQAYAGAPFCDDMLALVDSVLAAPHRNLAELSQASMDAMVRYFAPLGAGKRFASSSQLNVAGASTERLIDLCRAVGADAYLTGHGARHYLDHQSFETHGISVAYIDYGLHPYPQFHGDFTPYVSALDLIAQRGTAGLDDIRGKALPWREFLSQARTEAHTS